MAHLPGFNNNVPDSNTLLPDLTVCDREPITFLERIQSFGFLLAMSNDWTIVRASANLNEFLGVEAEAVIGTQLETILGERAQHDIRNRMGMLYATGSERIYNVELLRGAAPFDVNLHFVGELLVIEAEPSAEPGGNEAASLVRAMAARLSKTSTLISFLRDAARQIRGITGFDRVMIYRFAANGDGEVIAESIGTGVESFLGLNFPASDIPQQARSLYLRNTFRIIADVAAAPVAVLPARSPTTALLDMSSAITRAVSPVHIEYLRNMGVQASLSISIIVDGALWGLVACHHGQKRLPSFIARTAAELFGGMFSLMLESRLRQDGALEDQRARELADRLITAVAGNDSLLGNPEWLRDMTRDMIDSDGVAIFRAGHVFSSGLVPDDTHVVAIARLLNVTSPSRTFDTDRLASVYAPAVNFARLASGMLSIPISRLPRDYVLLFRREQLHSITWGGDPDKVVVPSEDGMRLSPRKSFEAFTDLVKGQSLPFTVRDRRIGEAVRAAMIEVILRLTEANNEDRRRATERQELLIAELNHRVRNILSLIRGLVNQTGTHAVDIASYVASLDGRVESLARAHDQVTRQNWGASPLQLLIESEVAAHAQSQGRVVVTGPIVFLTPTAISTMALVIHELLTNSVKYGALSSNGRIGVSIALVQGGGVSLHWREYGGPAVQAPKRRGFGSVIVERTVPFDLEGKAEVRYELAGLEADFVIPEQHVASGAPTAAFEREDDTVAHAGKTDFSASRPLIGLHCLLLEDNMIIAMEAEEILVELGAASVSTTANIAAAQAALKRQRFDFAMLDINVGLQTSFEFAAGLRSMGVPYLFASGYGDQVRLDPMNAGIIVVQKPYERTILDGAVRRTLEQARSPG